MAYLKLQCRSVNLATVIAAAHINDMVLCVQVMIGQNLTYQAGVLVYPTTSTEVSTVTTGVSAITIAVAVAVPIAALAVIAVLIVIGVVLIMRQTKQKKR